MDFTTGSWLSSEGGLRTTLNYTVGSFHIAGPSSSPTTPSSPAHMTRKHLSAFLSPAQDVSMCPSLPCDSCVVELLCCGTSSNQDVYNLGPFGVIHRLCHRSLKGQKVFPVLHFYSLHLSRESLKKTCSGASSDHPLGFVWCLLQQEHGDVFQFCPFQLPRTYQGSSLLFHTTCVLI